MSLFHHNTISFATADPLGDGLGDEIEIEQHEVDAMSLDSDIDATELSEYWNFVEPDDGPTEAFSQSIEE